ncbi:MAG: sulfurtransferase [Roseimicrobium sp.]
MPDITNISCYKFAPLTDLKPLRERLIARCKALALKGTILLSTEGINLFVAGTRGDVDALVADLRAIPGLAGLAPKYSPSEHQPFTRMLVRIKKEIIAFGVEGIRPDHYTSPKLTPRELKQWLDEGRPITLLDTRNDYEVKLGTFKGAVVPHIDHFRHFPEAVRQLPEELKQQPVVMFCTGGIRCEKAGPFMEREGFQHIFQLEGGILKYFEECGGAHYEGDCFVFDQRVGVDPALHEAESKLCFACLSPLTTEEQQDPRYVGGVSCPYCYRTPEEKMVASIALRHDAIRAFTHPLPGSVPYENRRPLNVPAEFADQPLLEFLCAIFPHHTREDWQQRCDEGRFLGEDSVPLAASQLVFAGQQLLHVLPEAAEPAVNADIRILHEDEAILVIEKPAPLPMHPCGRFNRNTLQFILSHVYAPQRPRFAHRLDANTTGLVLCARTRHFAALLQPQFVQGTVEKVYLTRVQGHPTDDAFTCEAPISAEPGELGSHMVDEAEGQAARTEFTVLRRNADGTALIEARPITGRTNQIRIHLWQLGFPICGDATYLPGQVLGDTQTLALGSEPLCLHAHRLSFHHPHTKQRLSFQTEWPQWANRLS